MRSNGSAQCCAYQHKGVQLMPLLDLHLGRPVTRGALTVFPVWNGAAVQSRGYDVSSAKLAVEERAGHAVVAELVITNQGQRPALVLEGELLEGGQQHRVAARSVLINAGESQVLDVRCVEEGRWSGGSGHVRSGRRAPMSVRAAQEQSGTWQRVRDLEARHGGGDTHFLGDALASADEPPGCWSGISSRSPSKAAYCCVSPVSPSSWRSSTLLAR